MFICNECGNVFEEVKVIEERHPYGMTYASEYFSVCPHCNDTNISEAEECSRCGEYVAETKGGLCDVCYGDMYG